MVLSGKRKRPNNQWYFLWPLDLQPWNERDRQCCALPCVTWIFSAHVIMMELMMIDDDDDNMLVVVAMMIIWR